MTLFPTKGNLIIAKNTLNLSKQGYDLLDKKRNILIHEMMDLIEVAKGLQGHIDNTFAEAYSALQRTNITLGIDAINHIGHATPIEDGIRIRFRSVMGVEIPVITDETEEEDVPAYGFHTTASSLDEAFIKFKRVKELSIKLAEIENSVYRLAINIKKTQKRANALKNATIPKYEALVKFIQNALEEKDREEFTRLKVIKKRKL